MDTTAAYEKYGAVHLRGRAFRDINWIYRFFSLYATELRKHTGNVWTRNCWKNNPDVGCAACPVSVNGSCPVYDTEAFMMAAMAYDPRHQNPHIITDYHRNRMAAPAANLTKYLRVLLPLIEDFESPHDQYHKKIKDIFSKWKKKENKNAD